MVGIEREMRGGMAFELLYMRGRVGYGVWYLGWFLDFTYLTMEGRR